MDLLTSGRDTGVRLDNHSRCSEQSNESLSFRTVLYMSAGLSLIIHRVPMTAEPAGEGWPSASLLWRSAVQMRLHCAMSRAGDDLQPLLHERDRVLAITVHYYPFHPYAIVRSDSKECVFYLIAHLAVSTLIARVVVQKSRTQ